MFDPDRQLSGHTLAIEDSFGRCKMGCEKWGPLFEIKSEVLHVTNMVSEPICQDVLTWKDGTFRDFLVKHRMYRTDEFDGGRLI